MLLIFFSEKQAEPAYASAPVCKNIEVLLTRAFFCNLLYVKKGLSPSALPPKSQNIAVLLTRASQRKVRTLKAALPFRKKRLDSCDSIQ